MTGKGWKFIVDILTESCDRNNVKIRQVKEKFGTLRFYTDPHDNRDLEALIRFGELLSHHICEETGKDGKLRNLNGWLKTLCDEEYEKRMKND